MGKASKLRQQRKSSIDFLANNFLEQIQQRNKEEYKKAKESAACLNKNIEDRDARFFAELCSYCTSVPIYKVTTPAYDPFDLKHKGKIFKRVREIGTELNNSGGFDLMYKIGNSLPCFSHGMINAAWDGIGEWLA